MSIFTRRRWSLMATALLIGAIGAQLVEKSYAGLGIRAMARSAQARADAQPDESARLKGLVGADVVRSQLWGGVSLGLVLLAAVCWAWARIRREIRTQRLLVALCMIYLLLFGLIV